MQNDAGDNLFHFLFGLGLSCVIFLLPHCIRSAPNSACTSQCIMLGYIGGHVTHVPAADHCVCHLPPIPRVKYTPPAEATNDPH